MVSAAFWGGVASGAEKGMDIRAAREAKASDTAIALSEAAKDRAIKQQSVDATIENTKQQIAQRHLTKNISVANSAITKAFNVAKHGGGLTKISDLPAEIQKSLKAVGHNSPDGNIGQQGELSYNADIAKTTAKMVIKGDHPLPEAGSDVANLVLKYYGSDSYHEVSQKLGLVYKRRRALQNSTGLAKANASNDPGKTKIIWVQTRDAKGDPVAGSFSKQPVDDNAIWTLGHFASGPEMVKKLNAMKVGREKYHALAILTYWSKRLKEESKDKIKNAHNIWYIKNNLADAYNTFYADMRKDGKVNVLVRSSIEEGKEHNLEFHAQSTEDLDNIRDILKGDKNVSKAALHARETLTPEETFELILKSGLTSLTTQNQLDEAISANQVLIEIRDRESPPSAQATAGGLVIDGGLEASQPKSKVLVVTVKPGAGDNIRVDKQMGPGLYSRSNVVETFEIPIMSSINGKKVRINSSEKIIDNPEFEDAITLGLQARAFGNKGTDFFNRQVRNRADGNTTLFNNYERYKKAELYKTLSNVTQNAEPDEVLKLKKIIGEQFDFSDNSIKDKNKAVDAAVMNAVLTEIKYRSSEKLKQKYRNGQLVTIMTSLSQRTQANFTNEDRDLLKNMQSQAQKIGVTMNLIGSYESDVKKIRDLTVALNGDDTRVLSAVIDYMENTPEFKSGDPKFLTSIGHTAQTWAAQGTGINIGTSISDYHITKNRIIQKITDGISTAKEVLGSTFFNTNVIKSKKYDPRMAGLYRGTARNFASGHDTKKDYMTQNTLIELEKEAKAKRVTFVNTLTRLEGESKALSGLPADHVDRVRKRAEIYKTYLQARLYSNRISLTYYYAGLVQGESGGRAISNEDFQVLFRALWQGGVGDRLGLAGVSIMKDVVTGLKEKNTLTQQYIGIGRGTLAPDTAYAVKTILDRSRHKNIEGKSLHSQIGQPLQGLVGAKLLPNVPILTAFSKNNSESTYNSIKWRKPYNTTVSRISEPLSTNNEIKNLSENFKKPWDSLTSLERTGVMKVVIGTAGQILDVPASSGELKPLFALNAFKSSENTKLGDRIRMAYRVMKSPTSTGTRSAAYLPSGQIRRVTPDGSDALDTPSLKADALKFSEFIYNQLFNLKKGR